MSWTPADIQAQHDQLAALIVIGEQLLLYAKFIAGLILIAFGWALMGEFAKAFRGRDLGGGMGNA